jgi:hypothetical protein
MPIQSSVTPPIPENQRTSLNLSSLIAKIGGPAGEALSKIGSVLDQHAKALRTPQSVKEFSVTDPSGKEIFWVGTKVVQGALFKGFWAYDAYLGGDDAETAPLFVEDGVVTFQLGGADDAAAIIVLDENGDEVVRIGKINDTPDEYGIYARSAKIGGPDVDNPVLFADSEGLFTIAGGIIRMGPGTDGNGGVFEIYDADGDLIATLGMYGVAAGVSIATTNAGLVSTTGAHGLVVDDFARIEDSSEPTHNRVYKVLTVPTSTSYTVAGMVGAGTGGTSTKQEAGKWSQRDRIGGTSPLDAPFVADEFGNVSITDATLTVTAGDTTVNINPTDGLKITDTFSSDNIELVQGEVKVYLNSDANRFSRVRRGGFHTQ